MTAGLKTRLYGWAGIKRHKIAYMHSIVRNIGRTLTCLFAATLFITVVNAQSVLGPAGEANHFIETPKGWTHPKTPWGDPDIQGMWPISFVGSVPLERCAGGVRTRRAARRRRRAI